MSQAKVDFVKQCAGALYEGYGPLMVTHNTKESAVLVLLVANCMALEYIIQAAARRCVVYGNKDNPDHAKCTREVTSLHKGCKEFAEYILTDELCASHADFQRARRNIREQLTLLELSLERMQVADDVEA